MKRCILLVVLCEYIDNSLLGEEFPCDISFRWHIYWFSKPRSFSEPYSAFCEGFQHYRMERRLYFVSSSAFRFTATPCIRCRKLRWTNDGDISRILLYLWDVKMVATSWRERYLRLRPSRYFNVHIFWGEGEGGLHSTITHHIPPRWRCRTIKGHIRGKVAGSIPDGVIGSFYWHNPSCRTTSLVTTQPLTEMSTRNISSGVKVAGA